VWPPQEEYLNSEIESLLRRGYPDPRLRTTVVPLGYPDPRVRATSVPQVSIGPISSREGKLYSRIRPTTEPPGSGSVTDEEKESGHRFNPVPPPEDVEFWLNAEGFPEVPLHTIEESPVPNPDEDTRLPQEIIQKPPSPSSGETSGQSPMNQDRQALILDLDEQTQPGPINQDRQDLILDLDQGTRSEEGDDTNLSQSSLSEHERAAARVDPNNRYKSEPFLRSNQPGPSNHPDVLPNRRVSSDQQRVPSGEQNVPLNQQPVPSQSRYNSRPWYSPTRVNCRHVEKVVKVQQCEPYTVETCWEEAKQECNPQPVTNCTGIVDTRLEQVCFNVEDELCTLVETVVSEKSEDSYQTQHCFFGQEDEVCGTSYEVQKLEMDDYSCTSVDVLKCHQVSQYIYDVNCVESFEFECKDDGYQPNTMLPRVTCTPNPTHNCYKIPRKVFSEVCEVIPSRHCESFMNNRAMPVEKPKCKHYTKKSCDFKIETSPKISKKFHYEKVCRMKTREICEHVQTRTIVPDCVTSERLSCVYVPHTHQCKYDAKHYCHLVDKVVAEEVCDTRFGYALV